jgi:hypothetical protein
MNNFETTFKVSGVVDITVFDEYGNIKDTRHITNKVVTSGSDFIANRMKDATIPAMSFMAVGNASTAPVAGDVWAQTNGAAVGSTTGITGGNTASISPPPIIGTSGISYTIQYQATFAAGVGTGTLQEAGLFNTNTLPVSGTGKMLARAAFNPVSKSSTDAMAITWTITIAVTS